jgi:D-glycero-alpha-D-manno-heptose-7-phosphate kinase
LTDGSGLASSSAYTIALIKAICIYKHHHLSEFEIAKLAIDLERQFNPLTGYQDSYGCAIGGFKRIDFLKDKRPSFTYFDNEFINKHYSMFLIHTGIKRSSTDILKSIDVEKCLPLLDLVEKTENAILQGDYQRFEELLNESWEKKKKTSSLIADSSELKKLDDLLSELRTAGIVRSLKLCGAGGGGYFLVFVTKDKTNDFMSCVSIEKDRMQSVISIGINDYGVIGKKI